MLTDNQSTARALGSSLFYFPPRPPSKRSRIITVLSSDVAIITVDSAIQPCPQAKAIAMAASVPINGKPMILLQQSELISLNQLT
jgi:hypothetical protein